MSYFRSYSDEMITSHCVGSLALDLHEETLAPVETLTDVTVDEQQKSQ